MDYKLPDVTDQQLREAGFTSAARSYPLSREGFLWLCHWNGVKPEQAPPGWYYAPNGYMQEWINLLGAKGLLVAPRERVPLPSEIQ